MDEVVISIMADGSVKAEGPGAAEFEATLQRWFKLMDIVAPEDIAAEIQRLAPTARRVSTQ